MRIKIFFILLLLVEFLQGQSPILFNKNETVAVYFSVTKIIRQSGDTLWAEVNAGMRDGMFQGSKGGLLTSFNDTITDRGNAVVATTEIVEVYNDYSIAKIIQEYPSDPLKRVLPYDNIYQKVYLPELEYESIFWELAKLNIYLLGNARESILDYQKVINIKSRTEELRIIQDYVGLLSETLDIIDTTAEALNERITKGHFNGLPLFATVRDGNKYDAYAYLRFVISFPARYMGRAYKFNETFATWGLNGTLMGDETKKWLSGFVLDCTAEEIPTLLNKARYYFKIDSLENYATALDFLYTQKNYAEVLTQVDKFIFIAQELNYKEAEKEFNYYKATTLNAKGEYTKALELWNLLIKEYPDYSNAYIGRSNSFYNQSDYAAAISDFKRVLKVYPEYATGYGNIGWYYILAGDLPNASIYCKKAYEMDSTSFVYNVNYGHTFLLNGNKEEAMKYYEKTLEQLTATEDYIDGPKKDFELFFTKGWKRKEVGEVLDWMEKNFELKYRIKLENNSNWDEAKALAEKKDYNKALEGFKKCIRIELLAYEPRMTKVHNAYLWTAYCFDLLNEPDSGLSEYMKALQLARLAKNAENEIDDLERIASHFSTLNSILGKPFENAAKALKEKISEESRSNNLYVLCIGLNTSSNMQLSFAETGARAVADSISKISKSVFNKVFSTVINNKPTKDSIEQALRSIAGASKPGDTFIFYFSGNAESDENDFALQCSNNSKVTSKQLSTWLSQVEATRQCIILDAPASAFIKRYISNDWFDANSYHDVFLLCPMQLSIEDKALGQSVFTNELLLAFSEASDEKGMVTAKGIDGFMFKKLGREGHYLQTQSYSFGKDFPLGSKATSMEHTMVASKRGSEILAENKASEKTPEPTSKLPRKDYALIFATSNYDEWNRLANPKKDADDIARELRNNYGFEVEVIYDATTNEMKSKLRDYIRKEYSDSDQLFLFFAGHGIFDEETKEGFIVCKDAKMNDENKNQYLSYADLREKINSIKCQHVFLCLDVCFGGTFDQRIARNDRGGDENKKITKQQFIESKREFKTRKFLTSGGKRYVSDGLPGHNSPFAARVLEGLRNTGVSKGYLTFSMLCTEMNVLDPYPRYGDFGDNDPGSEFIFDFKQKQISSNLPSQQKATKDPVN